MKKLIMILALGLSTITMAGTKEDFVFASRKYLNEGNKVLWEKNLRKIMNNSKADDYTRAAKFNLATLKIENGDKIEGKKYLKELIEDKSPENVFLLAAYVELYDIERNPVEKLKLSEEINKLSPDKQEYVLNRIRDYVATNNRKRADEEYAKLVKGLSKEEKDNIDFKLAILYANSKLSDDARKLVEKFEDKNPVRIKEIEVLLAIAENRYEDGLNIAKDILKYSKKNGSKALSIIENIYRLRLNRMGYLEFLANLLHKYNGELKDKELAFDAIVLAEELGREDISKKLIEETKNILSEEERKVFNNTFTEYLVENNIINKITLKYALKASKENNDGYIALAVVYFRLGMTKEALETLDKAIELNVEDAKKFKEVILERTL